MASIKGFQLKNVKQTMGREGYGCIASMYLNGKKIGTYADYGDGGCEDVDYVSKEAKETMMKVVIEYAKDHPNEFIVNLYHERPQQFKEECKGFKKYHPYIADEDITIETMSANSIVYIVEDVLNLLDTEKLFKKYQKKGYRAISRKGNGVTAYPISWSDEKIKIEAEGQELYMSLDDFNK
jgi:hypothetical protein